MAQRITIVLETTTNNLSDAQARIYAEDVRRQAQSHDQGFPVVVTDVSVEPVEVIEHDTPEEG